MKEGFRVARPFRVWLAVEVFFGLSALSTLLRFPDETATRFAWPITPTVMAAVLGGLYFSLSPVLVLVFAAKRWEMIRVIVLPAVVFTSAELVATLVHWDKFSVGTLPFNVWLASYILPPPIYVVGYFWHQRRAKGEQRQEPLPPSLRTLVLALGAFLTADSLFAFANPSWFTRSFPWQLTPLTARVLAGWLLLLGTVLLSIGGENDRSHVRLVSPFLILLLPLFAIQTIRYRDQVDASSPRLWIALVLFAVVGGIGVYLARGSWRESLA